MVSLRTVGAKFDITLTVIEGGSGIVRGILSETDQGAQPSYIFVQPRHILRATHPTAIRPGMVLQSPGGTPFIVGANGPSETPQGTLWQSFRLFEPTGQYRWTRRKKRIDPITKTEREDGEQDMGLIWIAMEPLEREVFDRTLRGSAEQARFITGAPIQSDDLVANRPVTRVDKQLGLSIGIVT